MTQDKRRDELIKELGFACTYCDGSGARQVSEDEVEQCQYCDEIKPKLADFILAREKKMLEEIEKPLKEYKQAGKAIECNMINMSLMVNRIQESLATINKYKGE